MNLYELFVKIGLKDEASEKAAEIGNKIGNGLKTAAKVGATAVAAVSTAVVATATAFGTAASAAADYGDNVDKMSQKMGMTAEAYQEWDAVMQHSGTSIEAMQASMKTLANAAETGNEAFQRLGITQEQLANMNQQEIFEATIAGLQNVSDTTERTYLAGKLLGRGATELGALLNTSAEDTQKMRDEVHKLGGVMSNDAVKAAARYKDSLQDMTTAFDGLKRNLSAEFLPAMADVMDVLGKIFSGQEGGVELITQGVNGFIEKINKSIPRVVEVGGAILKAIGKAIIDNLPEIVRAGVEIIMALIDGIIENIDEIVDAIIEVTDVIVDALIENMPKLIEGGIKITVALAEGLVKALPQLVGKVPELINGIVKGIVSGLGSIFSVGSQIVDALWQGISSAWSGLVTWVGNAVSNLSSSSGSSGRIHGGTSGGFAGGLDYVPYNGFTATLHKGESVLTAREAEQWRKGNGNSGYSDVPQIIAPLVLNITEKIDGMTLAENQYRFNLEVSKRHGVRLINA